MTCDSDLTARPPLHGATVVEFGGIGPVPFAAMLLADTGAGVHRWDRAGSADVKSTNTVLRGRRTIQEVDRKGPSGLAPARVLVDSPDVLGEGIRPAVLEPLSLGPDQCHLRSPQFIDGRVPGWGHDVPSAQRVVLSWEEAALDSHLAGRETLTTGDAIQLADAGHFNGPGVDANTTSESTWASLTETGGQL